MNEMQDKQYLALELTKITFEHKEGYAKRKDVMENYNYFLKELTGVLNEGANIMQLQMEIQTLQRKLAERTEKQDNEKKLHRLIDAINQCKGDMEPYVYERLMLEINLKIQ